MTPKDGAKTKPEWKRTLDRLLGTNEWEQALYKPVTNTTDDLFDNNPEDSDIRINTEELRQFISARLQQIFPFVAPPVLLNNKNNSPLFLFFFAVSNKNPSAWGLAQKATSYIIKNHNTS